MQWILLSHQTNPFPSVVCCSGPPISNRFVGNRLRPHTLIFCSQSRHTEEPKQTQNPCPSSSEWKSFAVTTGELFLGLASMLINSPNNKGANGGSSLIKERIGAVMEDEIEPEVIWERRIKDVEAEKKRKVITSPGFSFSTDGLLFRYHLGVAQLLTEKGYIKETTPLTCSSAGAIVCAVVASGVSMEEALKATKILTDDCRRNGTAFRLGAVLKDFLNKFLPPDVHVRSSGRVCVAVTQILWRPRGLLVDQFDSREDLINALITSSFIPGYLAPLPATMFRNRLCIDWGLTLFMPPTSAVLTVRVCGLLASCHSVGAPGHWHQSRLQSREPGQHERASLLGAGLEPAEDWARSMK